MGYESIDEPDWHSSPFKYSIFILLLFLVSVENETAD